MDVDETEKTLTNPDERIIKQITVEDIKETNALFDKLMCAGVVGRKEYIKLHSEEATYNQE
jgi:DNA gyrase/topoisomerase IV subunit B